MKPAPKKEKKRTRSQCRAGGASENPTTLFGAPLAAMAKKDKKQVRMARNGLGTDVLKQVMKGSALVCIVAAALAAYMQQAPAKQQNAAGTTASNAYGLAAGLLAPPFASVTHKGESVSLTSLLASKRNLAMAEKAPAVLLW